MVVRTATLLPGCTSAGRRLRTAQVLKAVRAYQKSRSWLDKLIKKENVPQCIQSDARALPIKTALLSLVWSNLMLHWIEDPAPAWREFNRVLETGGLLSFAMLGPDTLREICSRRSLRYHEQYQW